MRTLIADRPLDRSSKWDRISLTRRRFHSILLELPLYFQLRSCLVSVFPFFSALFFCLFLGNFDSTWVRMGFTGFTGFYWVLLGSTGFYWVVLGSTGFYWVLWVSVGFYWVLLGLTDVW